MPFPYVAVASAALGVGSSLFGAISGNQKENAAREARNEARKAQFNAQRNNELNNLEVQNRIDEINYTYQLAQTEALRFQEAQAASDFNFRQGQLTKAALANFDLNSQAITDQYITGEKLRATQDSLNLGYQVDLLALEANNAARQFMQTIQQNAIDQNQEAMAANRQMETLIQNQVLNSQLDTLQRDIQFAASLADRGAAKSRALGQGASASTANSLQMNAAKELGRSYGELVVRQRERQSRIDTLNATLQGEVATRLARFALNSANAAANLDASAQEFEFKGNYQFDQFEQLTLPSYELAYNQGTRDLKELELNTELQLTEAAIPYRENIIFDPLKPIPGMLPTFIAPNYEPRQGLNAGGAIVNAVGAGVQGALGASYTNSAGVIDFF